MSNKSTYMEMLDGTRCGTRYDRKDTKIYEIKDFLGGIYKNETRHCGTS